MMYRLQLYSVAIVLAVVQFGLVQHEFSSDVAHADAACEYCVAGSHHSPDPAVAPTALPSAAQLQLVSSRLPAAVVSRTDPAHLVRGPPSIA